MTKKAAEARAQAREDDPLREAELLVSDTIGRLIEFWGFKRNMGRVWALVYLSDTPLAASDLRARLGLSAGAVSMTLNELGRWGVVRKVWIQGARREHYAAEGNLWKMISRVLREREQIEIGEAIANLEDALAAIERVAQKGNAADRARALAQKAKIGKLLELAQLGHSLLGALVSEGRLDAGPLVRFLLGART